MKKADRIFDTIMIAANFGVVVMVFTTLLVS